MVMKPAPDCLTGELACLRSGLSVSIEESETYHASLHDAPECNFRYRRNRVLLSASNGVHDRTIANSRDVAGTGSGCLDQGCSHLPRNPLWQCGRRCRPVPAAIKACNLD